MIINNTISDFPGMILPCCPALPGRKEGLRPAGRPPATQAQGPGRDTGGHGVPRPQRGPIKWPSKIEDGENLWKVCGNTSNTSKYIQITRYGSFLNHGGTILPAQTSVSSFELCIAFCRPKIHFQASRFALNLLALNPISDLELQIIHFNGMFFKKPSIVGDLTNEYVEVSLNGGIPKWMVFFMENPI